MDTCWRNDQTGENATDYQIEDKSCACGSIKTVIADKMHKVSAAVGERAARQDAQSTMAQYGKQAADVLDQSAEYLQQLDYEQAETKAREYVRRNPGISLLIAGVSGLIIGAVIRRR